MSEVARVQTAPTNRVFAAGLIRAWRGIYGDYPTAEQAGVLWGQWMVETGGRACWNWNIGNLKVTPGQVAAGVPWIDLPGTWEVINGKRKDLPAGDPGRRFRAFASLAEGMREHFALLRERQFKTSWKHVEAGDPVGFVHALKAGPDGIEGTWDDYFTAPVQSYVDLLVTFHKRWLGLEAFDEAMAEVRAEDERATEPLFQAAPFATVTRLPGSIAEDEAEPPGSAA